MRETDDQQLMSRAAWLYHVGGLNQEETASRLGTTRARVNKLLQLAKDAGIVSVAIDTRGNGMMEVEDALRRRFNLERCICTPMLGLAAASRWISSGDAFARTTRPEARIDRRYGLGAHTRPDNTQHGISERSKCTLCLAYGLVDCK